MATVVMDREFAERLRQERVAVGLDRWDEVWEGTYMMAPLPNAEHQQIATRLGAIFEETVGWNDETIVLVGANVSDRHKGWQHNYRCPDVVVYLPTTQARNYGTHWCGGPDFAVEIVSDDDRTRDKIPFYSKVGTRELLVIDRDPWSLELLRLSGKKLKSVGISFVKRGRPLESRVLPLSFRLVGGKRRPTIDVVRSTDGKTWQV
ncbi:MAG: Uma2 family endonuclease [Planctomycetes bacterium]|nr:Uma2 family endonuclease [Planctomycetota bacterium]